MNIILFIILDVFNYPLLGLEKDRIYYVPTVNAGLVQDFINPKINLRIGRIDGEIKFHALIN